MREQLKRGENPRLVLSRHRERGPRRYEYTQADLAELFGVAQQTIYNWVGQGTLDPGDLTSICRLWHERQTRARAKP